MTFRAIFFFLLTLIVALAVDRGIRFAGDRVMAASNNRFVQLYHGMLEADLLILGNSRADQHFDSVWIEQKTGHRVTNLGLGGNHMVLNAILFEDYLDRHPPPRTVIVEVSALNVEVRDLGDLLVFLPHSARLRALAQDLMPRYALAARILTALTLNNDMFLRVALDALRPPAREIGSRARTRRMTADQLAGVLIVPEIKDGNLAALARIRTVAEARGIRFIPMLSPYSAPPERLRGLDNLLAGGNNAAAPVRIKDQSNEIQDPNLFADPTHMNRWGTWAWNQKVFVDNQLLD